jgi:hypothetical protein
MKWIKSIAIALGITVLIIINIAAITLFNVTYNFIYLTPLIVSFIAWLSILFYVIMD